MASPLNKFDRVAECYDRLVGTFFGRRLAEAQNYFLNEIPPDALVLLIGGGTGKIIPEIFRRSFPQRVIYVEASAKMIAISRVNAGEWSQRVEFIHGTENDIPANVAIDVIITPFFLDLFSDRSLREVLKKLDSTLTTGGIYIAIDFQSTSKYYHRGLLWLMYRFFRIMTSIESTSLPDWTNALSLIASEEKNKLFVNGFVKAVVYRKLTAA